MPPYLLRCAHRYIILSIVMIAGFTSCENNTQLSNSVDKATSLLEVEVRKILNDSEFVGIGVGVIRNGEVDYVNGFGYSNLEEGKEYSKKSIQPIGSISKLFIGN